MTTLCDEDIAAVVEANSHVIHCPRSNMKLASGTCPTQRLLDAGINVALGTDGAASNNRLNMLNEMQTAALLAKLHSGEPTALSAVTALEMATINGARALGYESRIGSIEVGKAADLIAIDLSGPATQPVNNVISQLVYATNGSELTHSWVAGRALIKDGKLITLDQQDVIERAQKWRETLSTFRQSKTATTNTHN
jgi:5-methylthioadenosine/S-adenosylhomocysteine deaminase